MHAYSLPTPSLPIMQYQQQGQRVSSQRSVRRESEETLKVTREYRTGSREKTHWGDLDIDIVKEAPHRIYFGFFPVSAYSKGGNVDYPSPPACPHHQRTDKTFLSQSVQRGRRDNTLIMDGSCVTDVPHLCSLYKGPRQALPEYQSEGYGSMLRRKIQTYQEIDADSEKLKVTFPANSGVPTFCPH